MTIAETVVIDSFSPIVPPTLVLEIFSAINVIPLGTRRMVLNRFMFHKNQRFPAMLHCREKGSKK